MNKKSYEFNMLFLLKVIETKMNFLIINLAADKDDAEFRKKAMRDITKEVLEDFEEMDEKKKK